MTGRTKKKPNGLEAARDYAATRVVVPRKPKDANAAKKKKAVNGRTKGSTAERKLAKLFADWWGTEFARTPMSGGFSTAAFRKDWNAAGDLVTPDPNFPFCVESKKVEGWTLDQLVTSDKTLIHGWWKQTVSETPDDKIPLLVFTKNRAKLFVMLEHRYASLFGIAFNMTYWLDTLHLVIISADKLFDVAPATIIDAYQQDLADR